MKIQCSCGAKYAFDITPEMAQNPVKFVCPGCGLDSSDYVNQLGRVELIKRGFSAPPNQPPVAAPRLRISQEAAAVSKFCSKHPRERATETCAVCHKPICPK